MLWMGFFIKNKGKDCVGLLNGVRALKSNCISIGFLTVEATHRGVQESSF